MGSMCKKLWGGVCALLIGMVLAVQAAPLEVMAQEHKDEYSFGKGTEVRPGDKIYASVSGSSQPMPVHIRIEYSMGSASIVPEPEPDSMDEFPYVANVTVAEYGDIFQSGPDEKDFLHWEVMEVSQAQEDIEQPDGGVQQYCVTTVRLSPVFISPPAEGGEQEESGAEENRRSGEELYLEKWRSWIVNPDSYLPSVTLADGNRVRSALPIVNRSRSGAALIVPGGVQDAERIFGKTDAANQVVIDFRDSVCGEEMLESLRLLASAAGGRVAEAYETEALERGKEDYRLIRRIGELAEPAEYWIRPSASVREELGQGSLLYVLQYVHEQNAFVWAEASVLPGGLVSVKTDWPGGTIALVVVNG